MRLSVNLFMSLDGVCQGPGGPDEDTRGGFDRGGWLLPHFDDGCGAAVGEWFERATALLLGRYTYDAFAGHWPHVTDPGDQVAATLNGSHKYVVSSSPAGDAWADTTTVLGGDFLDRVRALKAQDGDELQVHGSVRLARTLHEAGLVDVYRLLVAPAVVGAGARLFGADGPAGSFVVSRGAVTSSGVTSLVLEPRDFVIATATVEDGRDSVRD
ncbi:MAG TPA: dihydrofolate reductase family protein [Brevibacterium senegalense]|uniref:Dihydrofolate reductase family protein n=1 Tax=Brevibacterium senegalense TaxID=1033736 RepID=A0A921MC85_9MICO|nr:dihydrofolate reductase family protein [Brevibacterium senegalense]